MINVLIVGAGSIGERHARCFLATGRAVISLCEPLASRREEVARRYSLRETFASLEDTTKNPIDAAVIATPAHLHIPIALRLAQRGLHLLIEKPLGTSMEGIEKLRQEVQRRKI